MLSIRTAVVLGLAGCGSNAASTAPRDDERGRPAIVPRSSDATPPSDALTLLEDGFPQYPNARALTSGHVNGGPGGMHISWWTTATTDEPAVVVAHYQRLGVTPEQRDGTWDFGIGDHRLTVVPSAGFATFRGPGGDAPPAANEHTVLVFSRAARPPK